MLGAGYYLQQQTNKEKEGRREWQTRTRNNCMDRREVPLTRPLVCHWKSWNKGLSNCGPISGTANQCNKGKIRKPSVNTKCRQWRREIGQSHSPWMLNACSRRVYTKRHDGVAGAVDRRLCRKTWLGMHWKFLWYFRILTGHDIEHNRPDPLLVLDKKYLAKFIDIAIWDNRRVKMSKKGKLRTIKY